MDTMASRVVAAWLAVAMGLTGCGHSSESHEPGNTRIVSLPDPVPGATPLDQAIAARRSVRSFSDDPLDLATVGMLLWAAQGHTEEDGPGRAAPSAGGLYPLEVYVASADGLIRYLPDGHRAIRLTSADLREDLHRAGLEQDAIRNAPVVFAITGVPSRTRARYGDRAERYVILEAGHAAQNLLLEAVALDLGAVPIGAFDDSRVALILGLPEGEVPLYLIPVGYPDD